jgi:hypothetical protein
MILIKKKGKEIKTSLPFYKQSKNIKRLSVQRLSHVVQYSFF